MTMPADRERDRRSLQDLAKMAHLTPPPPSVMGSAPSGVQRAVETAAASDDSGIVDLAAASQADPQAGARAQSTALASQGLFDDEPQSVRPGPISSAPLGQLSQPVPSMPPPASFAPASMPPQGSLTPSAPSVAPAYAAANVHALPMSAPAKKKGNGAVIALVIGGVFALSAVAAGGLFVVKSRANVEATAAPVATVAATPTAVAVADPPPAATAEPTPAEEPPIEVDPTPAPHGKIALAPKAGGRAVPAAPAHAVAPKTEGPAKVTEKDLAAAPAGPGGDLGAAIKKEVGDKEPKPAAAVSDGTPSSGNVPQKPSQGAVTGALGAVLPGARSCLGPDDPISRASIMFGSNGVVQSVSVSGAAAGKPAEACIKGALTKAKLQPFAESTYTANITIRHN